MKFLETERTILRSFCQQDFGDLFDLMTDTDVMKYTGFRGPQSFEKIHDCLDKWSKDGSGPLGVWCVEEKYSSDFIGWFMLKDTGHEAPEVGFMISKPKWRKGFATEVCKKLLSYAFKELKYKKVIATTVSENHSSIAVLKKLNMVISDIKPEADPVYEVQCFEVLC